MPGPGTERRRSQRYLCSQIVAIRREPQEGRAEEGLLEDLSREGAAVAVEAPVPAGALVELAAPGLTVLARVCYCERRESDFRLGLEFTDGGVWEPAQWQPDHMFLPPPKD